MHKAIFFVLGIKWVHLIDCVNINCVLLLARAAGVLIGFVFQSDCRELLLLIMLMVQTISAVGCRDVISQIIISVLDNN
jgi:hypothetical protein